MQGYTFIYEYMGYFSDPILVNPTFNVEHPSNNDKYGNNEYRVWDLYVPTDFFIECDLIYSDTEHGSDYILFGDGAKRKDDDADRWTNITGKSRRVPKNFTSSYIIMIFTSDGDNTDFGFRIEFSSVERNQSSYTSKPNK